MPDPERHLRTLKTAIQQFRTTPGRRGRVVYLQDVSDVLIGGDMHGNIDNFRRLLDKAQLKQHPLRHLVVQELVHGSRDYPNNGGDKSHQLVDLVAALKCEFPRQVHFLLGNHELAQWQGHMIAKGDRDPVQGFNKGVVTAYGARAWDILSAYMDLFAVIPVAIRTPNRVFLSHSLPTPSKLDNFDPAVLERDNPTDHDLRGGGSIHSLVWGRDVRKETADAFLRKVDADLLISGHIPNEPGYEVPNDRQIILDSMRTPAGCCLFPANRPLTHDELVRCVQML
jgi:hypothetical protein